MSLRPRTSNFTITAVAGLADLLGMSAWHAKVPCGFAEKSLFFNRLTEGLDLLVSLGDLPRA